MPVVIDHGHGCVITDVDGNTFLDWSGGIGCLNVGHTNAAVSARAARAGRPLPAHRLHDRAVRGLRRAGRAAAGTRLRSRARRRRPSSTPAPRPSRTPSRSPSSPPAGTAVIAFEGAFHGRTLMAMSLTSKQHPYKAGMGPFAPEVYRAPFPNPYRWPGDDPAGEALAELRRMFTTHVAAENVAAIIFEPVQGEGGFVVPPAEWVRGPARDRRRARHRADRRRGAVRLRPHRQALRDRALRRRARPDHRRQVDRRRRAHLGRARPAPRSWTRPATARSAARTSARRWAASPRSRCWTRSTRRDLLRPRHRASASGSARASTSWRGASADRRRARPGPDAGARVRDRPGEQDAGARDRDGRRRARLQRGLILLKAGLHGNCVRVLVPLVATDEQIDEALDILSEAVAVACGAPALAAAGD